MTDTSQAAIAPLSGFRPTNRIARIADFIGDAVEPADFPRHILRFRNNRAAASVGLDGLADGQWVEHFGRFAPLAGSLPQPLALRYHGHQFRSYNPDLGDGRGFLYAQTVEGDAAGARLLDLGTKGSGQTPYSRFGDGRLTLKGGVREILATEMLEALGVPTSRTFSLIETGEELARGDEPSPTRSAVLVRLSHGHIRIGSFQRLYALDQPEHLRRLVDYALEELHGVEAGTDAPQVLYEGLVARCADLAASYMVAGFVHGVLNTDNIAVTGESFDYGPWRFTPRWDEHFTAAYFDHAGLYAFGRQAEAIHWNLGQMAVALTPIAPQESLVAIFQGFADQFQARVADRFIWRLGLAIDDPQQAQAITEAAVAALRTSQVPIDRFFFDWRGGRGADHPAYASDEWAPLRNLIGTATPRAHALAASYWQGDAPCSMWIDEVEAIWSAIDREDDWQPLHDKVAAIRAMGAAHGTCCPAAPFTAKATEI